MAEFATGTTASLAMNPPASATGPAGTTRPSNSSVSEVCSTTRTNTLATGPRPSRDARNIVRDGQFPKIIRLGLKFNFFHFPALCKDDPNGNVPLGKSCNRYWACQGGYPRLQRCPATLVFDKSSLRCVNPPTADCEAPPPQPAEEEEKAGGSRQQADDDEEDDAPAPPPRAVTRS